LYVKCTLYIIQITSFIVPRFYNVLNASDDSTLEQARTDTICQCNPDFSIKYTPESDTSEITSEGERIDFKGGETVCRAKVGVPCRFRPKYDKQHNDISVLHGKHMICVRNATCFALMYVMKTSRSLAVQNTSTYELHTGGMRRAYINYILERVTHVCLCDEGLVDAGYGTCLDPKDIKSGATRAWSPPPLLLTLYIYTVLSLVD
jgi:hypothetical protein